MRQARFVIKPRQGSFHPLERDLAASSDASLEAVRSIELLEDGTVNGLLEIDGDVDRVREIADAADDVIDYQLVDAGTTIVAFGQLVASPLLETLLEVRNTNEIVLEMPLEFTRDGRLELPLIGTQESLQSAMQELPDSVEFDVEHVGPYEPEAQRLVSTLTSRQRETLEVAVEVGYYQHPRTATQSDVADALGRSPATVGEHLRKIEASLFGAIVPQ